MADQSRRSGHRSMIANQTEGLTHSDHSNLPLSYVCCAADRTYGNSAIPDGLYVDVPDVGTTDPAMLGIQIVSDVFATARYHWRFPADGFINPSAFTEGLGRFYNSIATRNCPASVLLRLEDAVVANSIVYAGASSQPRIIYETYRPNDRPAVQELNRAQLAAANPDRFADPDWQNFFIGSAGSFNYGHWLVDDLPRLKAAWTLARLSSRPIRILIHSYGDLINKIRMQSIRLMLGAEIHIDLLEPDQPYHFAELFYTTPVSQHPVYKSPIALDFAAKETVFRAFGNNKDLDGPTLVFVDRSSRHGRALSNQAEIRELVESRGFTTVDPESMTFTEQVRFFAGAQVVIGQMGAAMTNTLFCRPATTVIYLAPSGWIEPFYWDLSVVRGHYYRVLFGSIVDKNVLPHCSDFIIDREMLNSAIDAL